MQDPRGHYSLRRCPPIQETLESCALPEGRPTSGEPLLPGRSAAVLTVFPAALAHRWVCRYRDCKMASIVPLKEKKLMEVKLGELPSWILMRNFTPNGIVGAFQRGYDRYYNKYINVRKGSISGVNMVLAAYVVFSYCISYKELKHERRRKYH